MKKAFRKYGLMALAAAFCAIGMQGCFIDSDCYTRTSCVPVCDFWSCYDDCVEDYICEDDYGYRPGGYDNLQCFDNRDCGSDSYCEDGRCYQINNGSVAFCGKCDVSSDCHEDGAVCVSLDDNSQACMRLCEYDEDCPNDFKCSKVEGLSSSGRMNNKQCLPINGSCDSNYCRSDADCSNNGECKNNRCEIPTTNLNECQNNNDCKALYPNNDYIMCYKNQSKGISYCTETCFIDSHCSQGYGCYLAPNHSSSSSSSKRILDSGICLTSDDGKCAFSSDCGEGMVCNNGKCMVKCNDDRDCVSDENVTFSCVSGICML